MKQNISATQKAWDRYIGGSEPIPDTIQGVRQEIVDSWRRSRDSADPFAQTLPCLSEEALEKTLQENALLIQIAYPYLIEFYENLHHSRHQITLADSHGCQLKRISDEEEMNTLSQEKWLLDGTLFSEQSAGTNGIGFCLALQKPVMVLGPEHFNHMYRDLACYGAPIYEPGGKLLGCINITGPLESYQPLIMGMLRVAVSGIQKEFHLTSSNHMLRAALEAFDSGVVVLNREKKILQYNQKIFHILKLEPKNLGGKSIYSILQKDSFPSHLQNLDTPVSSMECTLLNCGQKQIDVSVSVRPEPPSAHQMDTTLLFFRSQKYMHRLTNQLAGFSATCTFDSFLGTSDASETVRSLGRIAAGTAAPVLIFGEKGTERDILAQAIHNTSSRAHGPFVYLNCTSIPKALLESELLGYEGGAFSGARENGYPGKFELASGGTLFLDRIDHLPLDVQSAVLDVLQSHSLTRLGGHHLKHVDVKLIAATSSNLFTAVQKGTFRDDLFYRLNTLNIVIPPLRERQEDISLLIRHYAQHYSRNEGKPVPVFEEDCMKALLSYQWPGNVRELESVLECLVNSMKEPLIRLTDLPPELGNCFYTQQRKEASSDSSPASLPDKKNPLLFSGGPTPKMQEYDALIQALKQAQGNVKQASQTLQLPLSTLYRKLSKYHLEPKEFRD